MTDTEDTEFITSDSASQTMIRMLECGRTDPDTGFIETVLAAQARFIESRSDDKEAV
ncbi:MAG: hypothetical protein AAF479_02620 [Pseudomonadota bacterium]